MADELPPVPAPEPQQTPENEGLLSSLATRAKKAFTDLYAGDETPIGWGGSTLLTGAKAERRAVEKVGEASGDALAGVAGFDAKDPLTGGMSTMPEADATRTAGSMIGTAVADAPVMYLMPGIAGEAGTVAGEHVLKSLEPFAPNAAKLMSKAADHFITGLMGTAEAAAYSGTDTALKGGSAEQVKDAVTSPMNLLGAASAVLPHSKTPIAVTTQQGLERIADEVSAIGAPKDYVHPEGLGDPPSSLHTDDVKPSLGIITRDDTGTPVMRLQEVRADGTLRHRDMPLETAAQREAAKKALPPGTPVTSSEVGLAVMKDMSPYDYSEIVHAGPDDPPFGKPAEGYAASVDDQGLVKFQPMEHEPLPPTPPGLPPGDGQPPGAPPSPPMLEAQTPVEGSLSYGARPGLPDFDKQMVNETTGAVKQILAAQKVSGPRALANTVLDGVLGDVHRGPAEARQIIQSMKGARALNNPAEKIEAIRQGMPSQKLWGTADVDLRKVAKGNMSWEQFREKNPEVAQHAVEMMGDMIDQVRGNSKWLTDRGIIPENLEDSRMRGLLDQYVGDFYRAHYLGKGRWRQLVPTEALEDAAKYLSRENPKMSTAEATKELLHILDADDPVNTYQSKYGSGGAQNRLKEKADYIHPAIKRLLGHEESGAVSLGITLAHQEQLVKQVKTWDLVASSPYWSKDPAPGRSLKVPNNKLFGDAAGGYVSTEMEPFLHMPKMSESGLAVSRWLSGWTKGNQILFNGARPYVNNAVRNMLGASLKADGLRLYQPIEAGKYLHQALQALKEWKKAPVAGDWLGDYVQRARGNGALPSGFGHNEVMAPGHIFEELEKHMKAGGEAKPTDVHSFMEKLKDFSLNKAYTRTRDFAAKFNDGVDQLFKLANYMALEDRFTKRGMAPDQAGRRAALRINESFPNYEHVGKAVDAVRKNQLFGTVAPYMTGFMEDARNSVTFAKRMAEASLPGADPHERERMLSFMVNGGVVGAAYGMVRGMRYLNGISDMEVETAKKMRSSAGQWFHPATMALPWRDSSGRVQLVDLGSWMPELQLAYGHPDDPALARIAANLLTSPMQGTNVEGAWRRPLESMGLVRPQPQFAKPLLEGEAGIHRFVQDYASSAGPIPGMLTPLVDRNDPTSALRKGGVIGELGQNEEKYTPGQTAARLAGLPTVIPTDVKSSSKSAEAMRGGAVYEIKALQGELKDLARRSTKVGPAGDLKGDTQRQQKISNAIQARIEALQSRLGNTEKAIKQVEKGRKK